MFAIDVQTFKSQLEFLGFLNSIRYKLKEFEIDRQF